MLRWGYVVHHAHPNDSRPKPPKTDWVVLPTTNGKRWHETFPEVIADIEASWEQRHGIDVIDTLRTALSPGTQPGAAARAPYLPILDDEHRTPPIEPTPLDDGADRLATLMSQTLMTQALQLEAELPLSLALSANVVRVTRGDGLLVRDLPRHSGVAKQEATTMTNYLVRHGHAIVEPDPNAKNAKRLRLTDSGEAAAHAYEALVNRWDPKDLRLALASIPTNPADLHAAAGWRQKVKAPETLPHYPVITGHGGYPDGS